MVTEHHIGEKASYLCVVMKSKTTRWPHHLSIQLKPFNRRSPNKLVIHENELYATNCISGYKTVHDWQNNSGQTKMIYNNIN